MDFRDHNVPPATPVATDDVALLALVASDETAAFEQLFETHADFVYNVALRRTGAETEAEDITAQVFAELWRQRARIECRYGSLRPWLAGTAANLARRHWRSTDRKRTAVRRLGDRTDTSTADHADAVVERLDAHGRASRLLDALHALPVEQFDVITLSVWEGLTHQEVAEALGIAVGTVKSRLWRARAELERAIAATESIERNQGTQQQNRAWEDDRSEERSATPAPATNKGAPS